MKKLGYLIIAIAFVFLLPLKVNAKEKINVYLFRGEGCPHCQEAETFFDSIKSEYGKYYNLVDYETWYNTDNADLMEKVANKLGEKVDGVPYIIIGKKTWNGYANTYDKEITSAIKSEYNKSKTSRYDVIKEINGKGSTSSIANDILAILVLILVAGGITFSIIVARKKSS